MRTSLIFFLVLFTAAPLSAQKSGTAADQQRKTIAPSDEQVDQFILDSGLRRNLTNIKSTLESEMSVKQGGAGNQRQLDRIAVEAFQPDSLEVSAFRFLKGRIDSTQMILILRWLNSPLMKKFRFLEDTVFIPSAAKKMERYVKVLKSRPPMERRYVLVKRLEDAMRMTFRMQDLLAVMLRSSIAAMNASAPPEKQIAAPMIDQMIGQMNRETTQNYRVRSYVALLYAYRTVSDEELLQYIQFYESTLGQWFVDSVHGASKRAVTVATEKMLAQASPIMKEEMK
ncbi:MAG: hypothetical protein WBD36_01245 [Bacteroidota bacterium]